jgi:hypothetical protein
MRFWPDGNLHIGPSATNNGARLQVSGGNVTITNSGNVFSTIKTTTNTGVASYLTQNDINTSTEIGSWGSTRSGFGAIQPNNGYIFCGDELAIGASLALKFGVGGSNTERMRITSGGNVGINQNTPTNLLHLAGASATPSLRLGSISAGFHYDIGRENATTGDFLINCTVAGTLQGTYFRLAQSGGAATFVSDVTATRYFNPGGPYGTGAANARNHFTQFNAGNAGLAGGWISAAFGDALGNRIVIGQYQGVAVIAGHTPNLDNWSDMILAPIGNVLIGTITNNGNRLRVNGTIFSDSSVTATSFFESSDATIKTLVEDAYQAKGIESVVAKLYIKNGKQELGYFAQDLEGILPSAVNKGTDGLLNLSYREVHTAKIAALEKEIAELKKQLKNN